MIRLLLAPLLLALAACSGASDEEAPAPVALVTLAPVESGGATERVMLYGVVEPGAGGTATLSAPAEAQVVRIAAPVGTAVSAGQVVAVLAAAPTTRLDLAKAGSDATAADAALARAQRLRRDGLVSDAEVEQARAAARTADATRASLGARAGGLTLRAPSAGFVQAVGVAVGELVQPGAAVATITRPGSLRARFGADPALLGKLRPGEPLRIEGAAGRAGFAVPIASVAPIVDPQTRLASVFADLPARAGLGAGETLMASVAAGGATAALRVPYAALLDDGGQPYLFVVAGGVAHRRDVVTGATSDGRVAITRGLRSGERVVVEGGTAVEDGMKVRTR